MAKTMSCSELGKTKFFKTVEKVDGDRMHTFKKANKKSLEANKNAKNSGDVYQIRRGARIVKLNTQADVKEFKKEWGKKLGVDFKDKSVGDVIKATKGIYDGIMVGAELSRTTDDEMLRGESVKILNPDVLVNTSEFKDEDSLKEALKPYRESFKADGRQLCREMKDALSQVHNNLEDMKNVYDKYSCANTKFSNENGKYMFNGVDVTKDINELVGNYNFLSDKATASYMEDGKIYISMSECLRAQHACNENSNLNVSTQQVAMALNAYIKADSEMVYSSPENMLKNLSYESYGAYMSPYQNGDSSKYRDANGTIVSGPIFSFKDGVAGQLSKEYLNYKKQVWNNVIEQADPSQKEVFVAIAQTQMSNLMKQHVDTKQGLADSVCLGSLGDVRININDKVDKSALPEVMNKIIELAPPVNDSTSQTVNDSTSQTSTLGATISLKDLTGRQILEINPKDLTGRQILEINRNWLRGRRQRKIDEAKKAMKTGARSALKVGKFALGGLGAVLMGIDRAYDSVLGRRLRKTGAALMKRAF